MLKVSRLLLASQTWEEILARFPKRFQAEILDERSGSPEDISELSSWKLDSPEPVKVSMKQLLTVRGNLDTVARASDEAIETINSKWGLSIQAGKRYDSNPGRYSQYSQMSGGTAEPSTMINGKVYWGCGRFVAALMRGDQSLLVWKVTRA